MKEERFTVGRTDCATFAVGGARSLLLQPVGAHETDGLAREAGLIAAQAGDFLLAAFRVDDWNRALSPWPAPAVFRGAEFGGGASATLGFLETELLPALRRRCAIPPEVPAILGGYSLAGLFSLWCACETDAFAAVAAASPSVWFPGWLAYAGTHAPRTGCVYLSLGDREEKTKNKTLAAVGECVRAQAALLRDSGVDSVLEWNGGNHFHEPERRCAKGFAWCVNALRAAPPLSTDPRDRPRRGGTAGI